jgi:hypothetical protein
MASVDSPLPGNDDVVCYTIIEGLYFLCMVGAKAI